jgi:predicted Rossmann fold nucleotide-binding protein DprA/Smf involved in DNA uptake
LNLGIVGSRDFDNYKVLRNIIRTHFITWDIDNIVSGGAKGADTLAEQYADEFGINKIILPADWDKYGKRAGFIRNRDIWNNSDVVVAFWDGESKGTKHSFDLAKEFDKDFLVVEYLSKKIYYAHKVRC